MLRLHTDYLDSLEVGVEDAELAAQILRDQHEFHLLCQNAHANTALRTPTFGGTQGGRKSTASSSPGLSGGVNNPEILQMLHLLVDAVRQGVGIYAAVVSMLSPCVAPANLLQNGHAPPVWPEERSDLGSSSSSEVSGDESE